MPVNSMTDAETAVRRYYQALETGDTKLVDQSLAPDWEAIPALHEVPGGAEGHKATIAHQHDALSGLSVTIEELIVSGDRVAVRSVLRGTHTGVYIGVPGTGRQLELRMADFHRVADGRIAQTWHLRDVFGLAGQLGLKFSL